MGQIRLAVKVTTHAEHMESPAWSWHTIAAQLTPIPASTKPEQGELGASCLALSLPQGLYEAEALIAFTRQETSCWATLAAGKHLSRTHAYVLFLFTSECNTYVLQRIWSMLKKIKGGKNNPQGFSNPKTFCALLCLFLSRQSFF